VGPILASGVPVFVKLVLDENLSRLWRLTADGIDRGILGASDHDVLERAYQEDRVLVTSNVDDFVKLAVAREIHAGIVLVERCGLLHDEQIAPMREVAAMLAGDGATINELLRVAADGSMTFETSPS
jgi:predicted nuclease of predicted toxin-antitoxin system